MKNISALLLAAMFSSSAWAQDIPKEKIPANVISVFQARFTNAEKVKWEKENTGYEADFMVGKDKMSATFSEAGRILSTEIESKITDLPLAVRQSISRDYKDYKIRDAEKVDDVRLGKCFEVGMTKGEESYDIFFAPDGTVKEKIKEKKKEGNDKD